MRFLERIYRWSAVFAGFILFGLATVITIDVLKRWIFGKPFIGVFEFSEIAFLTLTFLALGLTEHIGKQMRVDIISSRVKGKPAHFLASITSLLGLGFWMLILIQGVREWLFAYQISDVRQGMIEVPSIIHLGFLVWGSVLIFLTLFTSSTKNLRNLFYGSEDTKE